MAVELTVLVDNEARGASMMSEHGLAMLIRGPGGTYLFDTAATGEALLHNAAAMGVAPSSIDAVILSHGHYDHTGGLGALAAERDRLVVYAHPSAFLRRWVQRPGRPLRDISCPHPMAKLFGSGVELHAVKAPEKLTHWLVLSGPVGGPPCGGGNFVVRKGDEMVSDHFEDELFCLLRGAKGWSILTGCCHRGLKNTLRSARFLAGNQPIVSLVGGLHMRQAAEKEVEEAARLVRAFGNPRIRPCHCTGKETVRHLEVRLPGLVQPLAAGDRILL